MTVSIDKFFLSKLIEVADVKVFAECITSIAPEMIKEPERGAYRFCIDYFGKYRKIPTFSILEDAFSASFFVECDAEVGFYSSEIINRDVYNKMTIKLGEIYPLMDRGKGIEALEKMNDGIKEISRGLTSPEEIKSLFSYGEDVWKSYERAKEGLSGISTPWKTLNDTTGGWQPEDLAMFVARSGLGKCVSWDSIVQCKNGRRITIKEFCNIREREIPSYNEKSGKIVYRNVVAWINSGVKKCFRVITRTGRCIDVTSCHPFFEYHRKWMKIDDGLKIGDRIAIPRIIRANGVSSENGDFIGMLAVIIAEGHTRIRKCGSREVSFSTGSSEILDIMKEAAKRLDCVVKERGSSLNYTFVTSRKLKRYESNDAVKLISSYGLLGKLSHDKFIPKEVFEMNDDNVAYFLSVLFSCDGWIDKNGCVGYCSVSKRLANDVYSLLLRFGIVAKIRFKRNDFSGSYIVDIFGSNVSIFKDRIGFVIREKSDKLNLSCEVKRNSNFDMFFVSDELNVRSREIAKSLGITGTYDIFRNEKNVSHGISRERAKSFFDITGIEDFRRMSEEEIVFDEIVNIYEVGEKEVYDLEIEDTHNFIANDIVVHNSWCLILLAKHAWEVDKKKVLFVSPELSNSRILARFLSNHVRANYESMRRGKLGSMMESKMRDMVDRLLKDDDGRFKIIGKDFGSSLAALEKAIIVTEPEIVFVDGVYLMERGNTRLEKHDRIAHVVDSLKGFSKKYSIPFVGASQLNRKASGKKDVRDDMLSFTDAFLMDSDYVFVMVQDVDMRADKIMNIQSIKVREGDVMEKMILKWDFENVDFSEVIVKTFDEDEVPF